MKNKKKKGFTLIELIVVIAILGILAAVAVPKLGKFRNDADAEAKKATEKVIESAAAMYHANTGSWPTSTSQLSDYLDGNTMTKYPTLTIDTNGQVTIP